MTIIIHKRDGKHAEKIRQNINVLSFYLARLEAITTMDNHQITVLGLSVRSQKIEGQIHDLPGDSEYTKPIKRAQEKKSNSKNKITQQRS